jgi:hypothetical protein
MARKFRLPGPLGSQLFTSPQPDINARGIFDSQFGLPGSQLVRVAAAKELFIDLVATEQKSLGPPYLPLPPAEASKVCQIINRSRAKQGKPPIDEDSNVEFQLTFGPQTTYHQPINRLPFNNTAGPTDDLNSVETDFTLQVAVNLKFHKDKEPGIELTATAQGSYNLFLLDPSRRNPQITDATERRSHLAALQAQLQLQAAYAFREIELFGIKLQITALVQLAGAMTYQYDPVQNGMMLSYTKQVSLGFGFEIPVSKRFSIVSQITGGGTGPASNVTGFQTIDGTFFIGGQIKF